MADDLLSLFDLYNDAFPMYDRAHLPRSKSVAVSDNKTLFLHFIVNFGGISWRPPTYSLLIVIVARASNVGLVRLF